jgi:hypothetical protein
MTTKTKAPRRRPVGKNKEAKHGRRDDFIRAHQGMRLLGEIITWGLDAQVHTHADVIRSLNDAGLDTSVAKEILPKHAFTRASRKLAEERVIDELAQNTDKISFQFTKRFLKNNEWTYAKETVLILNKDTGVVSCEDKDLQRAAQEAVDKAIEARTTADITKMIQTLFDKNADLFPIRDQGGVYFVPVSYGEFTDKIENFVTKLGGRVNRFPIPADTKQGDRSVQDAVINGLSMVIADHEEAIDEFGVTTRSDTIERQADRIKATRVKVEAYADYLKDRAEELVLALDDANRKLLEKVAKITEDKANAPALENGGTRSVIFGHSMTAVIRWMASKGWTFAEAKKVLGGMKGIVVSDATIRAQLGGWRQRGEPAVLSPDQEKELEKSRKAGE